MHTKLNIARTGRLLACALIVGAIAAPAASAMPSPDARGATPQVDLRMPDTRDAAESPTYVDEPKAVPTPDSGGFDWSTAGISVAAFAGLLIVSAAGVTLVRHGKREAIT
jgi:hypothetical protein